MDIQVRCGNNLIDLPYYVCTFKVEFENPAVSPHLKPGLHDDAAQQTELCGEGLQLVHEPLGVHVRDRAQLHAEAGVVARLRSIRAAQPAGAVTS